MKKGLIPFYRDLSEGNKGYTLFLDKHSNQVYKSYHKGVNNFMYWILFALVLIFFRGLKNVYLPVNNIGIILIVLLLSLVSAVVGIGIYSHYYKDLLEEYFTDTMIEEYIEKGKKTFIKEVISVIVVFLFVVLFTILFLIYNWLIWLIFALFLFSMAVLGLCGLPVGRFKLYKKGNEEL